MMTTRGLSLALLGLAFAATPLAAQQSPMPPFEELVYLSCSEAQAMEPTERVAVASSLADRATAHYGIALADNEAAGRELGILVRRGCTMFPRRSCSA
jgi:hypothetical protein